MTGKHKLTALALLIFGMIVLWFAAAPLPTIYKAQPITYLVETHDDFASVSVGARPFGGITPMERAVLAPQVEAVLDN